MFNELIQQLQSKNINWIGIARAAGLPRAMFSKAFNGHQKISPKNQAKVFHAILDITGALVLAGRSWTKDDAGVVLWISADDWNDETKRGLMDAHDQSLYLAD